MNILLLSYHSLDYDGRLNELIKVANKIGELFLFSIDSKRRTKNCWTFKGDNYKNYITSTIRESKKLPSISIIIIDGRKAIIPALIIKKSFPKAKVILDCREMDFPESTKHFSGKIGCYIETPCIKSSDVVIAANEERAKIMQERYKLKKRPLIFENIRALEFDSSYDEDETKEKFEYVYNSKGTRIISTAGCFADRLTGTLVKNFDKVVGEAELFLVGSSSKTDEDIIREIINRKKYKNVHIMGRVSQSELKFLIRNCHIGIVGYHQRTPNYKYCASGKIYEYLFEGIPVVTTTNPPLVHLCSQYQVGVSDDNFYNGINKLIENYSYFKSNVDNFLTKDVIESNVKRLVDDLHDLGI